MNYTLYIYLVILIGLSFSCEDKFLNDIDIDLPEEEQLLVINLELNASDTLVETFVARTTNTNEAESTFYDNAIVNLYKEDSFLSEMTYNQSSNTYQARFDNDVITEGNYRVEVSGIVGLTDISASQTIPPPVNISTGDYESEGTIYSYYGYTEVADEALITFSDPVDEDNFYQVKLFEIVEDMNGGIISKREHYISTINPVVDDLPYLTGLVMQDGAFSGEELTLSIAFFSGYGYSYPGQDIEIYLIAELVNITRDNYLYLKSLAAFENADGNPFAEPVIVHNNIDEGIGIFRAGNRSEFRIDFE